NVLQHDPSRPAHALREGPVEGVPHPRPIEADEQGGEENDDNDGHDIGKVREEGTDAGDNPGDQLGALLGDDSQIFPYAADDFLLMLRIVLKIRLHVLDQMRYSGVFIEEQVEEILVEPF